MHGLDAGDGVRDSPQYRALSIYIPQHKSHQSHLFHLFHHEPAPDPLDDDTFTAALRDFCTPAEELFAAKHHDPTQITGQLVLGWQAVIAHATGLGHSVLSADERARLAAFILELARFDRVDGVACELPGGRGRVWIDLPLLYDEVRQAWDYAPDGDSSPKHQLRWASLNAWVATLTSRAGEHTSDNLDFSLLGLWTVSTALELDSKDEGADKPCNGAIEAALAWLCIAPAALWTYCREGRRLDNNKGIDVPPFPPGDSLTYSEERWRGWEDRIKGLQAEDRGETMKKLLKAALNNMHKAERGTGDR